MRSSLCTRPGRRLPLFVRGKPPGAFAAHHIQISPLQRRAMRVRASADPSTEPEAKKGEAIEVGRACCAR
jgi:hypothetical protein